MSSKSKQKGNAYERSIVDYLKSIGCEATRAWGSNGKALGEHEEVDIKAVIGDVLFKLQLKRRKAIPKWLGLTENVDACIFREDRGKSYVLIELEKFVAVVK